MEDLLLDTLKPLGYPVRRQGSLGKEEEYPESFFTFWNNESEGDGLFDNKETRIIWDYDLNFYSTDAARIYSAMKEAKDLLERAGFQVGGLGHDVASDEQTHTGRGINITYLQIKDREDKENGR